MKPTVPVLFAAAVHKRFLCLRGCALHMYFHMLLVFTELLVQCQAALQPNGNNTFHIPHSV
jgi:hypothetical protein